MNKCLSQIPQEPIAPSSNCFFYLTRSPKPQNIQFAVIQWREKQEIVTLEQLCDCVFHIMNLSYNQAGGVKCLSKLMDAFN